jgi:phage gp16-like protein
MPREESSLRARELGRIHILKKELGLEDDIYRAVLERLTGVRSSALLDGIKRRKVIEHLTELAGRKPAGPARQRPAALTSEDRGPMLRKIEALLADQRREWTYADGIAEHMYGVKKAEFCKPPELRSIIAALSKDAERRKTRRCA